MGHEFKKCWKGHLVERVNLIIIIKKSGTQMHKTAKINRSLIDKVSFQTVQFPPAFSFSHCFPCLQSDIWADVHVQWFTSAADKRDARCLLQPAISCLVWHWVFMIVSTGAHILRYIKHTHTRAQTQTHTQIEPTVHGLLSLQLASVG